MAGGSGTITVKGAKASAEQRKILERALHLADRWNAPYKAKVALIEALIIESEAKNLSSASGDGFGSYGVLQGRDIYHKRSDLMDPDYQIGVFLGRGRGGKKNPKGFTGRGNAISLSKTGMKSGDIAQAIEGSAYPDRYQQVQREAMHIVRTLGGQQTVGPVRGTAPRGRPAKPAPGGGTQFDAEGFAGASRKSTLGAFLKKRNPNSLLLKAGAVSAEAPDPAKFMREAPAAAPKAATPSSPAPRQPRRTAGVLGRDISRIGHRLEGLTGLPVTARQEPGHASGGDHDPSVKGATARDFGGSETQRKAAFLKLTRQLGVKGAVYKGADINVVKGGIRYQIISRDHGTGPHLHVGARVAA